MKDINFKQIHEEKLPKFLTEQIETDMKNFIK